MNALISIYVDGSCDIDKRIGGYGAIIKNGSKVKEFNGAEMDATNNRMEVMGAIVALESLKSHSQRVLVVSDSQYLIKGASEWVYDWRKNGWRNSKRQPTPNRDLWERLIRVTKKHFVDWQWVKAHNGHIENERCDKLAKEAVRELACSL